MLQKPALRNISGTCRGLTVQETATGAEYLMRSFCVPAGFACRHLSWVEVRELGEREACFIKIYVSHSTFRNPLQKLTNLGC